jgi:hypothetical protein
MQDVADFRSSLGAAGAEATELHDRFSRRYRDHP